ncbi:tRNA (uracil(54)-C(5))-methyltransferase [Hypsizygus marmoreus]|uniref:tRNA (Uracil(54)-C(5))-methyltransferase n=1 Tax=Hypsizygus marmoreus TaxID=39966 RepID=A0A369JBP1_HYPMA|nr:tRNA (uracil(54)-C(5))-methyltransferase [Hypsizygus marmoreus]
MQRRLQIQVLKLSFHIAPYHTRTSSAPVLRPAYLFPRSKPAGIMTDTPRTGEVHVLPESELELPIGKKPRLVGKHGSKGESRRAKKRREKEAQLPEICSTEDVLWRDVIAVLGKDVVDKALEDGTAFDSPFEYHQEVELEISSICSSGEAIALLPHDKNPWTVILPFALPGERVRARIYRNARLHSFADLLEVVTPNSELRDPSRVKCKYFGSCAGCQYQMLSYETQLDLKRDVVVKAYKNFSELPESSVPTISSTIGSPLQYGYRTKLTPHFEAPPKGVRKNKTVIEEGRPEWLHIGFNRIGTSKTMDIEDCPIATSVINETYPIVRENIIKNIHTYKKGVSLLFRDSLSIPPSDSIPREAVDPVDTLSTALDNHVCITDQKATVREKVDDWIFEYTAGSFFQNNNSVLIPLIHYVRDAIFPPSPPITSEPEPSLPTHLVDAYCGAGLFAITLSPRFTTVAGIELSAESIRCATRNAKLNNIPDSKITFRAGDAADIFATVGEFPPDKTVLLIDPPRKGCDDNFIKQLLAFRCKTVVYVSCNVHTQARDVGAILQATENEGPGRKYVLESVRGFDLFPQTAHVESVAVLRLV